MKIIITLIVLLVASPAFASIKEAMQATVRFSVYYKAEIEGKKFQKRSGGSGVVYREDDDSLFLLTAAHILKEKKEFSIVEDGPKHEFARTRIMVHLFTNGFSSPLVDAKLHWSQLNGSSVYNDMAMLSVEKKSLGRYPLPKPIPLADKDRTIKLNERIMSCGCPNMSWPTAWLGHVSETPFSVDCFKFQPPPIGGRSGSAIFDNDGNYVVGILIWKARVDGGSGTAISPYGIHRQIEEFGNVQRRK